MNHSNITTAVLLLLYAATAQARDTDNNGFIDSLMAEMSIEEKIGQLNLPVGGDVVSGTAQAAVLDSLIMQGKIGGFFNVKGVDAVARFQRSARHTLARGS